VLEGYLQVLKVVQILLNWVKCSKVFGVLQGGSRA